MKNLAPIVAISIAAIVNHALAETVPPMSPEIQYMGRVARSDSEVKLAYPGIALTIRFTGPSITLNGRVDGTNGFFNATMDGVELPRVDLASGPFNYTFKHYLNPNTPHTLRLVRRNESWHGVVAIESVSLADGGALLPPDPLPQRKLLCIGDSITAGEKTDLIPPETVGLHTWNCERSYGWMLAKDFDAQIHVVAYGGKGLIRDWQGDETATNAPVFFERAMPDDPSASWDHSAYVPELVTICIGTNDFSRGIPEREKFVPAYIRFVERIHKVYPDAKVLLISGPWFGDGDPKKSALNGYIDETVAHFGKPGESFVHKHFFATTYPGTELDAHPMALQQRAMATDIGHTIHEWLGW